MGFELLQIVLLKYGTFLSCDHLGLKLITTTGRNNGHRLITQQQNPADDTYSLALNCSCCGT